MLEVLAVIAIVAYVIGRQLLGESLRGKRVLLLPAILVVVGLTRLDSGSHPVRAADIACLVVGGLIAAAIGAGQGAMMRLENREGGLWGRMPVRGLLLWAALLASRLVMTLLASALGAHVAASTAPVVLLLGVNRLGQAAIITRRALTAGIPFAREKDGSVFLAGRLSDLGARLTGHDDAAPHRPRAPYERQDDRYGQGSDQAYDHGYGHGYDEGYGQGHGPAYGPGYGGRYGAPDHGGRGHRDDRRSRVGRRAARRFL
ncbi:hypothetical protein [Actinacidiphila sp. bgisy145]|uniref:hypothetical protein n=1 Tax=Actinacidiphila sp. bgisy145 TaxID=3413792 RepID=UPI003EB9A0DC